MNGIHDLGGMHGFGPVDPEPNEPVFHHDWERRAFALNLAAGFLGRWNIDMGRYARDKVGVIDRDHGVFIFADAHAVTGQKVPQRCYGVRFEGRELWGPDAGPRDAIYIDLFEPYLEPAYPEGGA